MLLNPCSHLLNDTKRRSREVGFIFVQAAGSYGFAVSLAVDLVRGSDHVSEQSDGSTMLSCNL